MGFKKIYGVAELIRGFPNFSFYAKIQIQRVDSLYQRFSLNYQFTVDLFVTPDETSVQQRGEHRQVLDCLFQAFLHSSDRVSQLYAGIPQQIEHTSDAAVHSFGSVLRSQKKQ